LSEPTGNQPDLDRLLEGIRGGDAQCLARLYEATIDRIYGLVYRIIRNPADAEEICLDVYKQVWDQADRHDPARGPVLAWLTIMARSRALDRYRSHNTRMQHQQNLLNYDAVYNDQEDSVTDLLEITDSSNRVHAALRELSHAQREAITLNFLEGLSHQEIAERLDTPLGTIKSNIRRGLDRLRQILNPSGTQRD